MFESNAEDAGREVVGGAGVPFFWALALAAFRAAPLLSLLLALLSFDGDNARSLEYTRILKYQKQKKISACYKWFKFLIVTFAISIQ